MKPLAFLAQTLVALALATLAHAQSKQPSTSATRVRPMTSEVSNITAFFYQQPAVLNRDEHKHLHLKPADARFASKTQAAPLLAMEFPEACLEYPIVFMKGQDGQWLALALTGLQAGANAFVDTAGRWNARYIPASVRRYPFILAEGANNQFGLAADLAAPHFGKEGTPLFNEKGEPTEQVLQLMQQLVDFQNQAKLTIALVQKLDEAKLLNQQNLEVRLGDGRQAVVEGVWMVDEAKLRDLPEDKIVAWFKGGELAAVHAQMLSLRNLVPLLERSQPAPTAKTNK